MLRSVRVASRVIIPVPLTAVRLAVRPIAPITPTAIVPVRHQVYSPASHIITCIARQSQYHVMCVGGFILKERTW
jgi:predicted Co/Zn/Cd cation transporter (cation efflux family)